ncbi:MAG: hypothetical protein M5U33_13460 [Pseudorhodoplanes sp.]|nr:hypothetical protein [Pseudorhodoplanes sp.]
MSDLLHDDGRVERIAAADFEHAPAAREHLGGELVARLREQETARIGNPFPALEQTELDGAAAFCEIDIRLVHRIAHHPFRHRYLAQPLPALHGNLTVG